MQLKTTLFFLLALCTTRAEARTRLKEYELGGYYISVPRYVKMKQQDEYSNTVHFYSKSFNTGVSITAIRFAKTEKGAPKTREELLTALLKSIDVDIRRKECSPSDTIVKKMGNMTVTEMKVTCNDYWDKKSSRFGLAAAAETENAFYYIISGCFLDDKSKYLNDFYSLLYSLHE